MADPKDDFTTIIGPDAKFKGDISFESPAKVLGNIEGSVTSKSRIHVADGSNCKASVTAKEVAVEGHIEGNVEASDRVEVMPNGKITGDVVAARMNMSEGASINGYCRIGVGSGTGTSSGGAGGAPGGGATRQTEVKPASEPGKASTPPQQQQPQVAGKK